MTGTSPSAGYIPNVDCPLRLWAEAWPAARDGELNAKATSHVAQVFLLLKRLQSLFVQDELRWVLLLH